MHGDLDQSDYYYNKPLEIFEEEELKERFIMILRDIFVNAELRGEYDKAMKGFESCFEMSKEINFEYGICLASGGIALLYVHLDDLKNPKLAELRKELRLLAEKYDSNILNESALIGEAVILIFESRLKDRMKGQELLEGLIHSSYPPIKSSANEFLLISYLEEMMQTGNKDLLKLSKQLFDTIKPSMKDNLIQKLRFTILESKLHMIDGDLGTTRELLEDLLEEITCLGKKKMFIRFIDEINVELDSLSEEYNRWSELISSNASFEELLDKAALSQYITNIKNMKINRVV